MQTPQTSQNSLYGQFASLAIARPRLRLYVIDSQGVQLFSYTFSEYEMRYIPTLTQIAQEATRFHLLDSEGVPFIKVGTDIVPSPSFLHAYVQIRHIVSGVENKSFTGPSILLMRQILVFASRIRDPALPTFLTWMGELFLYHTSPSDLDFGIMGEKYLSEIGKSLPAIHLYTLLDCLQLADESSYAKYQPLIQELSIIAESASQLRKFLNRLPYPIKGAKAHLSISSPDEFMEIFNLLLAKTQDFRILNTSSAYTPEKNGGSTPIRFYGPNGLIDKGTLYCDLEECQI